MAGRAVRQSSKANKVVVGYRFIVSALLALVFITTVALLYTEGSSSQTVTLDRAYTSNYLHSYLTRTILALSSKTEPLKIKAEFLFKQANDQVTILNAYAAFARKGKLDVAKQVLSFTDQVETFTELMNKPEYLAMIESFEIEPETLRSFERDVKERLKVSRQLILDTKELVDNQLKIQKLKDTIFSVNDQLSKAKKQGAFANLIAAKSIPKSLHCLSMRLMEECISHPDRYARDAEPAQEWEDPKLYHYAIFSDNVIATSVVVNSVVKNANEPQKHVFHVVTDKMNIGAMTVWFKVKPPKKAHIEVKSVEDYSFLSSSYVPVLRQLESTKLQHLNSNSKMANATKHVPNMKVHNPKSLSMLDHLRFYLPEMFPKLQKILFLDEDVVIQKDLTGLWKIDMEGKVNGAVETCFGSFHRYEKYMNFSHPLIKSKFDPNACGWAYGMNIFDLHAWRLEKCTEEYHHWQTLNENRTLWKLGTLPPGLMTFYKTTKPLDKFWHVRGLGYNPNINIDKIKNAAVIHFNGNLKPWLDLAIPQYKHFWTKYIDYAMEYVQLCNFGH
ncbi:hypothetical protein O6H91_05G027300 [Diphasiastrum complanatum]|uniref:Uncharacterized protein n=2 Tax=Diphasiastrum complanatum TaxID=34168 RepID=A0ACC2DLP1_DIPCM|nr:hypothetical protein O6H91_05G027300 [Diphasiastrum complanatum]KAJ7555225.1 hypothetical protein O6H91_05G027300 [Diphasiastrum complanatum]